MRLQFSTMGLKLFLLADSSGAMRSIRSSKIAESLKILNSGGCSLRGREPPFYFSFRWLLGIPPVTRGATEFTIFQTDNPIFQKDKYELGRLQEVSGRHRDRNAHAV